jgi:hypothetical protein
MVLTSQWRWSAEWLRESWSEWFNSEAMFDSSLFHFDPNCEFNSDWNAMMRIIRNIELIRIEKCWNDWLISSQSETKSFRTANNCLTVVCKWPLWRWRQFSIVSNNRVDWQTNSLFVLDDIVNIEGWKWFYCECVAISWLLLWQILNHWMFTENSHCGC